VTVGLTVADGVTLSVGVGDVGEAVGVAVSVGVTVGVGIGVAVGVVVGAGVVGTGVVGTGAGVAGWAGVDVVAGGAWIG
jgi:hypothetical protein